MITGLYGMYGGQNRNGYTGAKDFYHFYGNSYRTEEGNGAVQKNQKTQEMRELLRNLSQTERENSNPFAANPQNKEGGILELFGVAEDSDSEVKTKTPDYNYKEVAGRIQQAKTAVSAGQAVITAKRKVMEVKRKIANGDGDSDELQLALTHARRMELVAKKKKRHLELEELIENTRKQDEKQEKQEELSGKSGGLVYTMTDELESKVTEQEDAIFEEREAMAEQLSDYAGEYEEKQTQGDSASTDSEELIAQLNQMISEYGEETMDDLEETMEQLELMEVVDPHMSGEEYKELKTKHRNSERKDMVKADMEYLKGMIRLLQEKAEKTPDMKEISQPDIGMTGISPAAVAAPTISISTADVAVSSPPVESSGGAVDISL